MADIEHKAFQMTDELVFVISDKGVAICTTEGHIHMTYRFNDDGMHASKNLVTALKEVYTAPDQPKFEDLVPPDVTH